MEELRQERRPRVVATCAQDMLLEYLREHQNLRAKIEGRLQYVA
jgi:hypothetical protein